MLLHSRAILGLARFALLGVCWCIFQTSAVSAPQSADFDLEGAISQQSKGKLTIDSGHGVFFHVTYDDKTTILQADGSPGSETILKVGVNVRVLGDLQDSGEVKAQRIKIQGKASSP